MKRRDTEVKHYYADKIFSELKIYDIQGLLKQDSIFKCGIESYQVANFGEINFSVLDQVAEKARYKFCNQLNIPFYIIIVSEENGNYKIFKINLIEERIHFEEFFNFTKNAFLDWWKLHQSFNQSKPMYNAKYRIRNSIIDNDLFTNNLAWGVNIDGFTLSKNQNKVLSIYEKRICTYSPPYSINNYDPNKYFHGTYKRSGDWASWDILFNLSRKLRITLILLTFDTNKNKKLGAAKIISIDKNKGILYKNNIKPYNNLFEDNLPELKKWLRINILK